MIVIADNDASTLTVLRYALEDAGYTVEGVTDGHLVWPMVEEGHVDLLILDLRMPGMNGWEVLRRLRHSDERALAAMQRDVPVIVVSGQSDRETREFVLRLGADAFMAKPIDLNDLRRTVRRALGSAAGAPA
jgi:CheY-like chemotaxis protein